MATRVVSRSPRSASAAYDLAPRRRPPTAPHTTRTSLNGSRSCTAADSSRASPRTSPARPGSAPASRAAAVSAWEQTSGICPAPGVRATSTSSSPTETTRHPRTRVHQHLVPAGRGEHADLRGAEDRVAAHRDVAGLDVLPDPADERRRRHAALHRQLGRAAVGVGRRARRRRRGWAAARRPSRAPPARAAGAADGASRPGSRRRPAARPASPRSRRRGRRCGRRSRRSPPGRSRAAGGERPPPRRCAGRAPPRSARAPARAGPHRTG